MMKTSKTYMIILTALFGLGLAACDQQQASSDGGDNAVPLQQQGAVPLSPPTEEVEAGQPVAPTPSSDPQ